MPEAHVVGAGQSDFGAHPAESYRSLFLTAVEDALAGDDGDEPLSPADVDELVLGTLGVGGRQLGLSAAAAATHVGVEGPATRVENACAAGGYAVRAAVRAVRAGEADLVLAGGVEVMNDLSESLPYWLGVSGETAYERLAGTTFSGVYAQMAAAHMDAHGTTREDLSRVAVKNHRNGARNPHAHLAFECTLEEAMSGPAVAEPLGLYHCCPTTDGAAAVLVASDAAAADLDRPSVRVAGVGAGSDAVGLFDRETYTSIPASRRAAERAYEAAGVGPDDLDLAEVHDCFSIAELLAYEDLGFCEPGESGDLLASGATALEGDLPVNTSGGLKAKGHPIGATGTGQIVELYEQLLGRAGERQVEGARRGLAHNVGGSGGAVVVHVLEHEEGGAA
ncbi:3-ketoacyl-CoA thiolase [Halobacteriales archaeon SW_5_70_135]|nr:MAG: 3-ketoacyl-CoA thiolase [Halobacteriales archaeon SW_5_70_135]